MVVPEILSIGEAMVLFDSRGDSIGSKDAHFQTSLAGAESNLAITLAGLGSSVEWFGRLGADPFGDLILKTLSERRVFVDNVLQLAGLNTGIYFKEAVSGHTEVFYYRKDSAGASIEPSDLDSLSLSERRIVHVTGITAAISESASTTVDRLVELSKGREIRLTFDVNFRPKLWRVAEAAPRLKKISEGASIVFVGRDEAESLWGTRTAADVRSLLPYIETLVVKDSHVGVTVFHGNKELFIPSLKVEMVEAVGAGDAFAAGFLHGVLTSRTFTYSAQLGHVLAAITIQAHSDVPNLPDSRELSEFLREHETSWPPTKLPPEWLTT